MLTFRLLGLESSGACIGSDHGRYRPELYFHQWLCLEAGVGKGRDVPQITSADVEEHGRLVAAVLQVMRIGIVHPKRDAVAGHEKFFSVIGHQHQLAGDYDHDLVVGLVPVPLRRPGAGF